ncbi:MAG: ATPase, T2SS/T4P/T4SS family [Hellea sp.]
MNIEKALIELGVNDSDIQKAKGYQNKFGGVLEKLLVNMGSISEDSLPDLYSKILNAPLFNSKNYESWEVPSAASKLFNLSYMINQGWLPLSIDESQRKVLCLVKEPLSFPMNQYLMMIDWQADLLITNSSEFDKFSSDINNNSSVLDEVNLTEIEEDRLRELASEAPTVNLLNSLITRAIKQKASDMHVEPVDGRYRVRYRVDGVLHDVESVPQRLELALVSRLKILSGMDIAEKRRPQDGKIEMRVASIPLDIRVSVLPLHEGESVVMRFLRKDALNYDFSVLGLSNDVDQCIRDDLTNTAGVILLTGPTGSGKTTTLYTFLNELNNGNVKIITLEDPVEYQLPGLNQVQIRPEIGFDFSAGLRSVVRQDPDIVMIGEIRDSETCRIAMQAALTGHLVFSTVHTNDAPSAYTRLLDLGVQEFLLNAGLVSIIAQRLARKICDSCSQSHHNSDYYIKKYDLHNLAEKTGTPQIDIRSAKGCAKCNGTGYKGRFAVVEYLRCDDEIKAMPKDEQFITNAKKHNSKYGFRTLFEDGLFKVIRGETTIDEIIRVCG